MRHYFAAWTDSGCLLGCDHQHDTVVSAVACCNEPGSYVIAVEKGVMRELNEMEEAIFQHAMYGHAIKEPLLTKVLIFVLLFISQFADESSGGRR